MSLKQLCGLEHVEVSRRGRSHGPLDQLLAREGLQRRVRVVVPNQLAAAVLVAQSELVSIVSRTFASAIRHTLAVEHVAPPLLLERASIGMAFHPRFDADAEHAFLRKELLAVVSALG